jgi:oligogalacturonide lyase
MSQRIFLASLASACAFILTAVLFPTVPAAVQVTPPTDWVDPATGHRVIRLSRDSGTATFYFHQGAFTAKGDKLVVSIKGGLATIDLTNLGVKPCTIEPIVTGNTKTPTVGGKSRQVYYVKGNSIYATHVDTKETREIAKLPAGLGGASGLAVNADETLLASTGNDPKAKDMIKDKTGEKPAPPPAQGSKKNFAPGGRSMALFTVNIKSGEVKKIHYATDWLNHTQFSPTDPQQILFCHEGTWDLVDRIWTIRADGTGLKKMHTRGMDHEIFGHEFFSSDGKSIWYDLQTPRSTHFWLAGVNIATGERTRYKLEREQWSVHFNQSLDGKLFAGDGGGPNSVAARTLDGSPLKGKGNGQWIYLFTPKDKYETIKVGKDDIKVGTFDVEKLVDLKNHNYTLEPNVRFTPDNRWVVFRSNMHGPTHVYAVEVTKAKN